MYIASGSVSNWTRFTAHQWTLVYFTYVLKGILVESHLKIWSKFVVVCQLICKTYDMSLRDVQLAKRKFCEFGQLVARTYGVETVTLNMHKHVHLNNSV